MSGRKVKAKKFYLNSQVLEVMQLRKRLLTFAQLHRVNNVKVDEVVLGLEQQPRFNFHTVNALVNVTFRESTNLSLDGTGD